MDIFPCFLIILTVIFPGHRWPYSGHTNFQAHQSYRVLKFFPMWKPSESAPYVRPLLMASTWHPQCLGEKTDGRLGDLLTSGFYTLHDWNITRYDGMIWYVGGSDGLSST